MKLEVTSIALIAAAALALTGCADADGPSDDAATFAPTAAAGTVTVTLPASINNYAQVNTKQLTAAGGTGSGFNSLGVMAVENQLFSGNTKPSTKITLNMADGSPMQSMIYPEAIAG